MMNDRNALVEITNVRHFYHKGGGGDFLVLDNINLTLYEDEITCLLGRSGSGKSTLMRSISGLIEPTEGSITIQEKTVTQAQQNIAMVFQSFALFPWMSVLENVEIGLQAQNINPQESRERALSTINLVGLDGYEGVYPHELSGGMQQRVGLARALVVKPLLLLMDEPFSALDMLSSEILRADLLDIWIEGQMTTKSILMVSHNIEEAVLIADRILLFGSNPGHIIEEVKVTLPHPRNRLTPEFRALVDDLYEKMTLKDSGGPKKEGFFQGMGIGMALPYISSNVLQGFIENIASNHKGRIELAQLVDSLNMGAGEILKIAEILQLFRFCEIKNAVLYLTEQGAQFAAGTIEARKKIFCNHLEKHIPLAGYIRNVLDADLNHSAPIGQFRKKIETYIPSASAQEALKAVISWARYAELFMFDEKSGTFFLEQ